MRGDKSRNVDIFNRIWYNGGTDFAKIAVWRKMNMESLRKLVKSLEKTSDEKDIIKCLQSIERALISDCLICVCGIEIEPLWVEAYYFKDRVFADCNSHLSEKQKNRFGQVYFHETGRGGFDICLSLGNDYYLSFLIKSAIANGEYITQTGIYKVLDFVGVSERECEQEKNTLKSKTANTESSVLFATRVRLQKPCYKDALLAAVPLEAIAKYDFKFARESLTPRAQEHIVKYINEHSQCTKDACKAECRRVFGWFPDIVANTIKKLI